MSSYRKSHTVEGKAKEYQEYYQKNPWQAFLWSREQQALEKIIRQFSSNGEDIHHLDFACGTGRILSYVEKFTKSSVGVDISSEMLTEAKKHIKYAEIVQADITNVNIFNDVKFDLITAFRFFLNAEQKLRLDAMQVLSHLLKEDGLLVINNHHNFSCPAIFTAYIYNQFFRKNIFNVMSYKEVKKLLIKCDLEIVDVFPVGFGHFPRFHLSNKTINKIEDYAVNSHAPHFLAESPIYVCKKR